MPITARSVNALDFSTGSKSFKQHLIGGGHLRVALDSLSLL